MRDSDPRLAPGEGVGPKHHHGAHDGFRQGVSDPGGVADDEVALELAHAIRRDGDVGKLAESRRDPVDALAARGRLLDDAPRARHRPAGGRRQGGPHLALRDTPHVGQREVEPRQYQALQAAAIVPAGHRRRVKSFAAFSGCLLRCGALAVER